jgi:hypothetical protein
VKSVQRLATGCKTERSKFESWLWGPPNILSNGYQGALSREVKRPGREADYSPQASAEVKNMWIYTSTPPYAFMA